MIMNWTPGMTLEAIERVAIEQAFKFYRQNKTQTASSLGISVRTLDNKLEIYDGHRKSAEAAALKYKADCDAFNLRARGLPSTAARVQVEPAAKIEAQHQVPMPERKEVQEVLPTNTGSGRTRVGRKRA